MNAVVLVGTRAISDMHDVHECMIDFLKTRGSDIIIHCPQKAANKFSNYLPEAIFESVETEIADACEGDILITSQVPPIKEATDKGYAVIYNGDNYKQAIDMRFSGKIPDSERLAMKKLYAKKLTTGKVVEAKSIATVMETLTKGFAVKVQEKLEAREKVRNKEDLRVAGGKEP